MNPLLDTLHPYPFERLRQLLAPLPTLPAGTQPINLSIGEPKHAAPLCVEQAITKNLSGLSVYPATKGELGLRQAIAKWLSDRYNIPLPNADTQVLPVAGSREALFAFTQAVVDRSKAGYVILPNPFYQIYEGATILAGVHPYYVNADPARGFSCDWDSVPDEVWRQTQLVFVCSPGNPAGNIIGQEEWRRLFELSDRYGFLIASDECYSEIYLDEQNAPIGALQAAIRLGRDNFPNLVVFSSLSKRSNVPGLRSGFVAGDAALLAKFLLYRTYHGCALSPLVQSASIAAWNDETHVRENRRLYCEKFDAVVPILKPVLEVYRPAASFYLWAGLRGHCSNIQYTQDLYAKTGVTVLPGSYLARDAQNCNPGQGRIRIALVAPLEQCVEAAHRIAGFR
jgi:N-succinyldiaminopimelate aminotransferase